MSLQYSVLDPDTLKRLHRSKKQQIEMERLANKVNFVVGHFVHLGKEIRQETAQELSIEIVKNNPRTGPRLEIRQDKDIKSKKIQTLHSKQFPTWAVTLYNNATPAVKQAIYDPDKYKTNVKNLCKDLRDDPEHGHVFENSIQNRNRYK